MEVKAPEGYKPIKDPVLHFTISYEKPKTDVQTGEITKGRGVVTLEYNEGNGIFEYAPDDPKITPEEGKLVDYVTSATAKNMGKIINEVPGKGSVKIKKFDDNGATLKGAEFKLVRTSKDGKVNEKDVTLTSTSKNIVEKVKTTVGSNDTTVVNTTETKALTTINPITAGAKEISGTTIGNSKVTLTLPGNSTLEAISDNTGKFVAKLPDGVTLANGNEITASINEQGVVVFDNLPIGQYELEETKAPKGYQNKGKKWRFTVGGAVSYTHLRAHETN